MALDITNIAIGDIIMRTHKVFDSNKNNENTGYLFQAKIDTGYCRYMLVPSVAEIWLMNS